MKIVNYIFVGIISTWSITGFCGFFSSSAGCAGNATRTKQFDKISSYVKDELKQDLNPNDELWENDTDQKPLSIRFLKNGNGTLEVEITHHNPNVNNPKLADINNVGVIQKGSGFVCKSKGKIIAELTANDGSNFKATFSRAPGGTITGTFSKQTLLGEASSTLNFSQIGQRYVPANERVETARGRGNQTY